MALTRRQKQVLDFLTGFINKNGYSPSFEEIGKGMKLTSLATVHKHVQTLEKKGFIRRGYNQSRSIDVIAVPGKTPFGKTATRLAGKRAKAQSVAPAATDLPLLGLIAAGRPVEAVPDPETISLADMVGSKEVYVLRVKGDSMIDDHILDGDYVLVEGRETAENGEIIVALTEGTDATLKRFFRHSGGRIRLQPANAEMEPIIVDEKSVKIQGRVIGILRKY